MMSAPLEITQQDIQSRASSQSFSRGQTYYHNGYVSYTIRRSNEIEAECQGSYPEPYRVSAILDRSGIISTSCTCEYDWGGDCKHIVAMLLTYLHEPEQFEERDTRENTLTSRSKEDLIDIIEQMIRRYPDLQDIVDRPVPQAVNQSQVNIDTQSFRRELRKALNFFGGWMDRTAESKVYEIANVGKRFATQGDYANAIAIYCTILEECNDHDYPTDDEGDYVVAVNDTIELLKEALSQLDLSENGDLRRRIIDVLVGTFIWDVDFGGIGYGDYAPDIIKEIVLPKDIGHIREPIEIAKDRKATSSYGSWGVEAYERFLIELDALDSTDPEETLKRLKEQGMYHLMVVKLLNLKRNQEAIDVIREHLNTPYELLRVLHLLVEHDEVQEAINLAEASVNKEYDPRLADWLITLYNKQGNSDAHFTWQFKRMQTDPSVHHYEGLKTASKAVGNWNGIRPQILEKLQHQEQNGILTLIYLHDEEWDLAWETLEKVTVRSQSSSQWVSYNLDYTVAEEIPSCSS